MPRPFSVLSLLVLFVCAVVASRSAFALNDRNDDESVLVRFATFLKQCNSYAGESVGFQSVCKHLNTQLTDRKPGTTAQAPSVLFDFQSFPDTADIEPAHASSFVEGLFSIISTYRKSDLTQLTRIVFKGWQFSGLDLDLQDRSFPVALHFDYSVFRNRVNIQHVVFESSVTFVNTHFTALLTITLNTFKNGFLLKYNSGQNVLLDRNIYEFFSTINKNSLKHLTMRQNLYCGDLYIIFNSIERELEFVSNYLFSWSSICHDTRYQQRYHDATGRPPDVIVESNVVNRAFYFSPLIVDEYIHAFTLRRNTVQSLIEIEMPFVLNQQTNTLFPLKKAYIDLTNTSIPNGVMRISHFRLDHAIEDVNTLDGMFAILGHTNKDIFNFREKVRRDHYAVNFSILQPFEAIDKNGARSLLCDNRHCEGLYEKDYQMCQRVCTNFKQWNVRCDVESRNEINLGNVDVLELIWGFEKLCSYTWSGAGLRFEKWSTIASGIHDEEFSRTLNTNRLKQSVRDWRAQLKTDHSSLIILAEFAENQGFYDLGRRYREEAAEWSYEQTDTWTGWLLSMYLLPTGSGARPEKAVLWLALCHVICGLVYKIYASRRAKLISTGTIILGSREDQIKSPQGTELREIEWRKWVMSMKYAIKISVTDGVNYVGKRMKWILKGDDNTKGIMQIVSRLLSTIIGEFVSLFFEEENVMLDKSSETESGREVSGFAPHEGHVMPHKINVWIFSLDAILPVVNLQAFQTYYPSNRWIALLSHLERFLGWWFITAFLASSTILSQPLGID